MKDMIFLNDYETVKEALLTKKVHFAGRPQLSSTQIVTSGSQSIGFSQHSDEWWYRKKVAGKALRYYLQGPRLEAMVTHICKDIFPAMEKEGPVFNSKKFIGLLIYFMLYDMCFGKRYSNSYNNDHNGTPLLDQMFVVLKRLGTVYVENYIPFLKDVWPSHNWCQMLEESKKYRGYFRKEMQKHKDSFNPENIRDYTDSLIFSNEEIKKDKKDKGAHHLTDTEISLILGDVFIGNCRPPSANDRENLQFLEACMMESIRRGTVATRGIPHQALCDTSVGGYDVPKGTIVMINYLALHTDPKYWKNVTKFDPHHFLQEDGTINHKPDNWLPFSAGRRVCLGEPVVRCELVLIAAHLLQNFDFTASSDANDIPELGHVNAGSEPPQYPKILLEKRVVNY
ncbi:hypothetical protein FSP39_004760 [Pinctada imbricata]|uniref:Uncharacterized protein n=1 Tax=Pinctada imbricata TaxID=66713 RepID=A0AA88XMG8_PINIB|nr:hypothetical protein FSP39_004760 [Pinctada imbricata]